MAVVAPIPRARVRIATREKAGFLRSWRRAEWQSDRRVENIGCLYRRNDWEGQKVSAFKEKVKAKSLRWWSFLASFWRAKQRQLEISRAARRHLARAVLGMTARLKGGSSSRCASPLDDFGTREGDQPATPADDEPPTLPRQHQSALFAGEAGEGGGADEGEPGDAHPVEGEGIEEADEDFDGGDHGEAEVRREESADQVAKTAEGDG
jgi:hypothetical protein